MSTELDAKTLSGGRKDVRPARRPRTPAARGRLPLGLLVSTTAFLWLTTSVAAAALWPVYQSIQLIVLVGVSILAGSIVAIVGALYRWSSMTLSVASMGIYLLLGVPLAVPSDATSAVFPTLAGELELLRATALGWKELLTITLPVGSYQSLLVPAFLLVLATTVIGLSVGLRARVGELGVLAPIILFVVAIVFGPATATMPLELSLGLLASVLGWLVWRRWYRRRESIRLLAGVVLDPAGRVAASGPSSAGFRTIVGAVLIVVLVGGGAVVATLALPPTAQRHVLRQAVVQPFDPRQYPSPLSGFRRYEEPAQADSTMLSVTGLPTGGRIRIATLDTYDGIVFSVGDSLVTSESGSFTRVPYTYDQSAVRGTPVSVKVTVDHYAGVWLPTVGKLTDVSFGGTDAAVLRDSFFYNNESGTAAVVRPVTPGDSYTLSAVMPRQPAPDQLGSLRPGSALVPPMAVVPDGLSSTLNDWVKSDTTPGAKLVAMIAAIKTAGYVSHGVSPDEPISRSGHSADRITQLLTDQRMIGDQEQFAVTAAIMARQLGFPSRVVFGFAPGSVDSHGTTQIRGKDISAWIEVDTSQYGWVTIDPTPGVRPIPQEQPQKPITVTRPQSPVQPPQEQPQPPDSQLPPGATKDNSQVPNPVMAIILAVLRVAGFTVLGIAIVLAPFLAIVVAKLQRRRRRKRAPSAAQRISGGWREFEDAVLDHGFVPPPHPTRTEVAETVGGIQPLVLAAVADRAAFAPTEPLSEEADQVWRAVRDLRLSLGAGRSRRERLRAAISLRSLGGYSVKSLFTRRR
jgi:transglutaminase-like putative cysteine protease